MFIKICGGVSTPGFGGSITGGGVSNMDGENCDPGNYSGYFLELNIGGPGFGAGYDIGLTDKDGNFIPDGFSDVNEAGVGTGSPCRSVFLCYYIHVGTQ